MEVSCHSWSELYFILPKWLEPFQSDYCAWTINEQLMDNHLPIEKQDVQGHLLHMSNCSFLQSKPRCCTESHLTAHEQSLLLQSNPRRCCTESHPESPIACLLSFLSYVVCLIAKLISLDSAHGKCAVLWLVSMVTESVKGVRWFFVCKLQPLPVANLIGSFLFGSFIVCT